MLTLFICSPVPGWQATSVGVRWALNGVFEKTSFAMQLEKSEFGIGFYLVSVLVSGLLFFAWRRLFRRVFRAEGVVVIATAMAAIITTPVVLLALLWVLHLFT
ncbi:MAG: hypothetical protein EOO62_39335 [Hymenobacter sp.]|nr:MAG: hypothetical protein EOO62_39335 [Hymenobacter sp.]